MRQRRPPAVDHSVVPPVTNFGNRAGRPGGWLEPGTIGYEVSPAGSGLAVQLIVTGADPGILAYCYWSTGRSPVPFPIVSAGGLALGYLDPVRLHRFATESTGSNGTAVTRFLPIQGQPELVGLPLYFQWLLVSNPLTLSTSDALELEVICEVL